MASLTDILARKKEVTGQISTQTRSLALGFLAISWALLTAHDEPLHSMAAHAGRLWILWLAAVAVCVLICDLLQYHFAAKVAEAALQSAETSTTTPKEATYDTDSWSYCLQVWFYKAKFAVLVVGAMILLFVFLRLLTAPAPPATTPSACTACCTK